MFGSDYTIDIKIVKSEKRGQKKGRNRAALRPDKHIWGHGYVCLETKILEAYKQGK